jgi:hypothetical protein
MHIDDNQMMVDIETLSTRANAVVLSVGAALFNFSGVLHSWHWTLKLNEQIGRNRHIDADTLAWWMSQDSEIMRQAFKQEYAPRHMFLQLAEAATGATGAAVSKFWAHSPAFDYVILDSLKQDLLCDVPWDHRSWLDTRTLSWMKGKPMKRTDGQHNAERDAIMQAEWVIEALK